MLGSSRVAAQLAASQEGLSSMSELVSNNSKQFVFYLTAYSTAQTPIIK
jgi:hypothetical protein